METISFPPGDAKLTRRVKKLAAAAGVTVHTETEWNGYGREVVAYEVEEAIFKQAREEIEPGWEERERREAEEAEARRRASDQRRADEVAATIAAVSARCPWMPTRQVKKLVGRLDVHDPHYHTRMPWRPEAWLYDSTDAAPHGLYTREQWRRLGYGVRRSARPAGYVIGDRRLLPLYDHPPTFPARKPVAGDRAWAYLLRHYRGDESLALTRSVWVANRLAKLDAALRRQFYALKDRFLALHADCLVEGRVARVERKRCWGCHGTGVYQGRSRSDDWDEYDGIGDEYADDTCRRCWGTGVYRSATLYEWRLNIAGRPYCFHSYAKPPAVSDTPGADLDDYGRRFTDADLTGLPPVPLAYYLPALCYRVEEVQYSPVDIKQAV